MKSEIKRCWYNVIFEFLDVLLLIRNSFINILLAVMSFLQYFLSIFKALKYYIFMRKKNSFFIFFKNLNKDLQKVTKITVLNFYSQQSESIF